jgi:hypothetical protein
MSIIALNSGTIAHYLPTGEDVNSSVTINGLQDVEIVGLNNGQILQYNTTAGKWENVDPGVLTDIIDGGTY